MLTPPEMVSVPTEASRVKRPVARLTLTPTVAWV